MTEAFAFLDVLLARPSVLVLREGDRHWPLLRRLSEAAKVKGSLFGDAYLAALAVEHGCELVSADRDFGRFPVLRWTDPSAG